MEEYSGGLDGTTAYPAISGKITDAVSLRES